MTDDNVTRLPEPGVVLDLDAETRPDAPPPYVIKVNGKSITFADPDEVDWQDLVSISIPADLLRVSLSKEDRKHLNDAKLPTWKFRKVIDGYYEHYNLEEKLREARQQAQFAGL